LSENQRYNEKELFLLIADGDSEAFSQFYYQYAPILRAYAIKTLHDEDAAEDVLQAIFIRVWLSRDRLINIQNPPAWLYTITVRLCLQHFRTQKRQTAKHNIISQSEQVPETPASLLEVSDLQHKVREVVNKMPEKRRQIFILSREQGEKPAEIAQRLSMPVGTVKNHLHAANREIREFLQEQGYTGFALIFLFINIF